MNDCCYERETPLKFHVGLGGLTLQVDTADIDIVYGENFVGLVGHCGDREIGVVNAAPTRTAEERLREITARCS